MKTLILSAVAAVGLALGVGASDANAYWAYKKVWRWDPCCCCYTCCYERYWVSDCCGGCCGDGDWCGTPYRPRPYPYPDSYRPNYGGSPVRLRR